MSESEREREGGRERKKKREQEREEKKQTGRVPVVKGRQVPSYRSTSLTRKRTPPQNDRRRLPRVLRGS